MKNVKSLFAAAGLAVLASTYANTAQAQSAGIALGQIEASSTRGSYFVPTNLNDGNLTSAWGPHADDLMPSLTFNLGRHVALSTMEIKLSPAGAVVDVEMSSGGTWRTVATGLRPQAETLARITLPNAQGDRVRLKFTGASAGQLLVCEVRLYGENATWTPSPTPVPVPTATTGSTGPCTDVTGNGWIAGAFTGIQRDDKHHGKGKGHDKGHGKGHEKGRGKGHEKHHDKHDTQTGTPSRISFSFDGHERVGRNDWGQIRVDDAGRNQHFAGSVTNVIYQGRNATLTGNLNSGGTFTAVVVDNPTNRRGERFRFTTSTGYTADGNLGGGDLQVRRYDCR